jgi:hypothetical protein
VAIYSEYDLELPPLAWRRDETVADDTGRAQVRGIVGVVAHEGNRDANRPDTRAVRLGESALLVETDLGHADQTGRPTRVSIVVDHPFMLEAGLGPCTETVVRVLADAGLAMEPARVRAALAWGLASTQPRLRRLDALLRWAIRVLNLRRTRWDDGALHAVGGPA